MSGGVEASVRMIGGVEARLCIFRALLGGGGGGG